MGASWSAPVRNFFNRGKVKDEVQHGVEVVVNATEQGLQKLDEATSGAVTSLADELSKAGVDLNEFKNQLVEGLNKDEPAITDDVHTVENEVSITTKKGAVENIGHGLKDEFHHVETQTEKAKEETKTEENAGKASLKTEETVSSITSNLLQSAAPSESKKEESPSLLSQGIQMVEETASAVENELLSGLGIWNKETSTNTDTPTTENTAPKTEDNPPGWTTSLLTKEKELVSNLTGLKDEAKEKTDEIISSLSSGTTELKENLQTKKEQVETGISDGIKQGEELASNGVEKATQGLSFIQETLNAKKDEIVTGLQHVQEVATAGVEKVAEDVENIKKEADAKKKEITSGFSSDLHFLQDTVVASKDVVVEALHLGRPEKTDEEKKDSSKSAPEFKSTQKPLGTSPGEEKPADTTEEQSSKDNITHTAEVLLNSTSEEKMDDKNEKKETSPIKEVTDFLKQEISDASKHIQDKKEEVKEGVSEAASAVANEAQVVKHSIFDSFTDISSTITNTLHNIETEIENTGKNVLTGVGTKVKEAGDFIAGTEEEIDDTMDDKELKTEAVTSLLDKSFI